MAAIVLERVTKMFGEDRPPAVRDLDLAVDDGELLVLVGPSGCGKSTTLRLIAGLESPSAGRIRIGDRDVTNVPSRDRDLAMVFQSYALYPHRTVRQNMAFGLRMRNVDRAEIARRVESAAEALGITALLDRKPAQLSGGQRQRVALGRAIVREPRAFLFDEPLSNLDPRLRVQARTELTLLHRRLRATMVHVTHDQEEAMTLGDRVAVLRDGELQQCAEPAAVYRRPANVFVAQFIGSPEMNLFACRTGKDSTGIRLLHPAFTLSPETDTEPEGDMAGTSVTLGIRPHDIRIVPEDEADAVAVVNLVELLGSTVLAHVRLANASDEMIRVLASPDDRLRVDQSVGLRFDRRALHLFDARTGERTG